MKIKYQINFLTPKILGPQWDFIGLALNIYK
jgi:hypothetical protein